MYVGFFDAIFFFNEVKAKNCLYYMLPIPLVQEYGSLKWYLLVNVVSVLVIEIFLIEWASILAMVLYWNTICCNEIICMSNELKLQTYDLEILIGKNDESWKEWDQIFERCLQRGVEKFQRITE